MLVRRDELVRLGRELTENNYWALKEPRISILLPMWLDIFNVLSENIYFINMVRSPVEVAASLNKRNGFSFSYGYLLWLKYVIEVERNVSGKTMLVNYHDVLSDPCTLAESIGSKFGLDIELNEGVRSKLSEFITPNLRHHHDKAINNDSASVMPALVRDVYECIVRGDDIDSLIKQYDDDMDLFSAISSNRKMPQLAKPSIIQRISRKIFK